MGSTTSKQPRAWYLDFLRILATISVVALHTAPLLDPGLGVASAQWRVQNAIACLMRWNVPVFFMISGALFLSPDRELSTKRLYGRNLLRMVTSYLFWSAVYALVYCLETGKGKWTLLNQLLRGHYHMWYIFTIIGLYALTPLLRKITESKKATEYLLAVGFLFSFLIPRALGTLLLFDFPHRDVLESAQSVFSQMNPYSGFSHIYYFVLGYALHAYPISRRASRLLYGAALLGGLAAAGLTDWHSNLTGEVSSFFFSNASISVLAMSVGMFLLFKRVFSGFSAEGRVKKAILFLSTCSYGVYLSHLLLIERLHFGVQLSVPMLLLIYPLLSLAIYALSLLLSAALNGIPGLRRYIV